MKKSIPTYLPFLLSLVFCVYTQIGFAQPGCTDPNAHNYDPNATSSDGSCETCYDGVQNGDEEGVDCGGANPLCSVCPTVYNLDVEGNAKISGLLSTGYLYPGLDDGDPYRFIRFGEPNEFYAGLMWNNTDPGYGNGDDFTIFTYGNRDISIAPSGSGNTYFLRGNVGIGQTTPIRKLEVREDRDDDYTYALIENGGNGGAGLWLSNANTSTGSSKVIFRNGNANQDGPEYWALGNDKTDGNKFKINPSTDMQGSSTFVVSRGGNVGIGTNTPSYKLELSINSAGKPFSSAWDVSSDRRLKKNIQDFTDGLAVIKKIRPVTYYYNGKANLPTEEQGIGTIAQELQKAAPYMVKEWTHREGDKEEDYLSVDYHALQLILVNAVQEMADKEETSTLKIAQLEAENKTLQTKLSTIETELQQIHQLLSQQGTSGFGNIENHQKINLHATPTLEQNIPNPFNHSTNINYYIPETAKTAKLQITNLQGQVLQTRSLATGKGQITLDQKGLADGAYAYSLIVDGQVVDTKQMILTK